MKNEELARAFSALSTPLIADAMLRLDLPPLVAPPGVTPLRPGTRLAGRVQPVRHYGSVDIFIEVMAAAEPGDVLVIDNRGRTDEACIGDLTALEARAQGLGGIVVWGLHRDTAALREIDLPVFSYGVCPFGPLRLDEREPEALSSACFGDLWTTNEDAVFADDDGVIFAPLERAGQVVYVARQIHETERRQAQALLRGQTLYEQLRFREYLAKRETDPDFTLRNHLREIEGAIEE